LLEDEVLDHLQQAQEAQRSAWGESERIRLGAPPVSPASSPKMGGTEGGAAELGHRVQTQIYRQVLLGAITELWVDYLTRVEALRVSVGLEAYAQQDPLVKYKSQASEMFQALLADIRAAVIGRIFLYQPRAAVSQAEAAGGNGSHLQRAEPSGSVAATPAQAGANQAQGSGKKRKRHRH